MRPILNLQYHSGLFSDGLSIWLGRSDNQKIRKPYTTIPCDIVRVKGSRADIVQLRYLLKSLQKEQEESQ